MKQQMKAKVREGSSLRKEMRNLKKRKNTCTMVDLPGIGMNLQIDPLLESLQTQVLVHTTGRSSLAEKGENFPFFSPDRFMPALSCGSFFLET